MNMLNISLIVDNGLYFVAFSVSAPSSAMRRASFNTLDKCFLRPYLTREEYIYWSSHSSLMLASCACSDCTSPRDATAPVFYQHKKPPVSFRNVTGIPCRGKDKSGCPIIHSGGFGGCRCGQAGCGPVAYVPKTPPFSKAKANMGTDYPKCSSMDAVSMRCNAGYSNQQTVKAPLSSNRFVPAIKQLSNAKANQTNTCEESASKTLRRISEQYLCGDRSFDEVPPIQNSTTNGDETSSKTNFSVLCYSTNTDCQHPEGESTASFPVKRKSSADSEPGNYSKNKQQRQAVYDGVDQNKSQYNTIELNDSWKKYLDCSLPINAYESGRKTFKEGQTIGISQKNGITDTEVMSLAMHVENHQKIEGGKSLERTDELFKTAKPIPRRLFKDGGMSSVSGGYALDYDCLPKLVDVLPSNLATVISGSLQPMRE